MARAGQGRVNIMKKLILAAALSLLTTTAFAGATLTANGNSKSNGSIVGQLSSAATGNGDGIGGNGDGIAATGYDDTSSPGSRADAVHGYMDSAPGSNGVAGGHSDGK
jgi:hypothetical protein